MTAKTMLSEVLSEFLNKNQLSQVMTTLSEKKELETFLKKRVKDPNAPKKARSSFIYYCQEHREKVQKSNPGISPKEVSRKLGVMWKALSDSEKKKFETLALKDRERYESDMAKVSRDNPSEAKAEKKPKKLSAYQLFAEDERLRMKADGQSLKDCLSLIGPKWKAMSEEQKKSYTSRVSASSEVRASEPQEVPKVQTKNVSKPKEETKKPKEETKKPKEETKNPKEETKKSRSTKKEVSPGFKMFEEDMLEKFADDHPEWSVEKRKTEVQKQWKKLTNDERQKFEDLVDEEEEQELEDE